MSDETFDVFLSHNSKDKPAVRQIKGELEARGLKVWLDESELVPGRRWVAELERNLESTRTVAVCIGGNGFGPWERPEVEGALSESVDRGLPVIPVLLPDAPADTKVPLFLKGFTWVDLRGGLTPGGLDRLKWGITGEKPAPKVMPSASIIPPRLHNLPFSTLGDLLKGRDNELRELQNGQTTAITQAQTLYGLGGIGKTRLAVEYAWRSGNLYDAAFFVVAESPEALNSNLANLAHPNFLNLPEYEASAQEKILAAVLRWLRDHGRWLLILDNVDTKEAEQAVMKMVPILSAGRVLITSRIKNWPAGIQRQQIETLSLDEAQRFLLERTESSELEQALRLAEELGGLPLALEQAAAYILQRQVSLAEYLEEWEKERERVLNWYDPLLMQYPRSVAVTWQTTFQQLSPTAAAILRLTAYLAPDPIPSKMFEEGVKIVEAAAAALCEEIGQSASNRPIKEALSELVSYSMVTRDGDSFTVHRMVQDALRSRIPGEGRRNWVEGSLRLVNDFSPPTSSDVRTWSIWDFLRPHVARVVQYADDAEIAEPTSSLMNQLVVLLLGKSVYREAEPLMRRALQIGEDTLGPQHPTVAIRLNNLAQLLKATNRLAEAEPLMRRALQIDEDSFGPQHPNVARDLNNLARLLQATNRLGEAEPLMRRAVDIVERSLGTEHPNTQTALRNLDGLLREIASQSEPPSSPEGA